MLCGPKDHPPSFPSGVSLSEDVPACQGPDHKENPRSYWGPGKMSLASVLHEQQAKKTRHEKNVHQM